MAATEENESTNNIDYARLSQMEFALTRRNSEAIIKIMERGYSINYAIPPNTPSISHSPELIGRTALHFAVSCSEIGVDFLLRFGADFTIQDAKGSTALHHFVEQILGVLKRKGPLKCVVADLILSAHVEKNIKRNPVSKTGLSHFHVACMTNDIKAVQFFLNNGMAIEEVIYRDSPDLPGYTPLHIAIRYSSLDTILLLLAYGADINAKDAQGMTVLEKIPKRNKEILEVLEWIYSTKLYRQLRFEFEVNAKVLLQILEGGNTNSVNENSIHRFHIACIQGNAEIVADYLKSGVDINASVHFGFTALHYAAHFHYNIVKLLMSHGADIFAKDDQGKTPFDICIEKYEYKFIDLIISIESLKNFIFSENLRSCEIFLALRSYEEMKDILESEEVINGINNHFVRVDSPIWPGYTLLHLAVLFSETIYRPDGSIKEICNKTRQMEKDEDWLIDDDLRFDYYNQYAVNRIIVLLIRCGADFTIQDANGQTPLHLAFKRQNLKAIRFILSTHFTNLTNPYDNDGLSHLHIACLLDDTDLLIEAFLRNGMQSVNSAIKRDIAVQKWLAGELTLNRTVLRCGWTPLHMAVACNNREIIQLLINYGADVFATDADGLTPIHAATHYSNYEIIDLLLDAPDVGNSNPVVPGTGLSHFHAACISSRIEIVVALLELGADVNCPVKQPSKSTSNENNKFWTPINGYTPVHFATVCRRTKTLELLFQQGANVAIKNALGWHPLHHALKQCPADFELAESFSWLLYTDPVKGLDLSQLHIACIMLKIDTVESLLISGADVNKQVDLDSCLWPGYTALHMAVSTTSKYLRRFDASDVITKSVVIIELLLKHGADVTIQNANKDTPLHMAQNRKVVNTLLGAKGVTSKDIKNKNGISHFHIACVHNAYDIVEEFFKLGANVNEPQHFFYEMRFGMSDTFAYGFSTLHIAVMYCDKRMISMLLERGANIHAEDRQGRTPLHVACEHAVIEVIEVLLSAPGIKVDILTIMGETPLQRAVHANNERVVRALVFNGADINFRHPEMAGWTPLHIAIDSQNAEGVATLLMMGADINATDQSGKTAFEFCLDSILSNNNYSEAKRNILMSIAKHAKKLMHFRICDSERMKRCLLNALLELGDEMEQVEYDDYENELTEMHKLYVSKYSTLRDAMLKGMNGMVAFERNEDLKKILSSDDTHQRFPKLLGILNCMRRMAQEHRRFLEDAEKLLNYVSGVQLPKVCSDAIASYLSHDDLNGLKKVFNS